MARETRASEPVAGSAKRKRRSTSPNPSFKVILPNPSTLANNASPSKDEQEPKRAKRNIRIKRDDVRVLSQEVREGLAMVIQQMAAHLPSPINNVLGLHLPPDFTPKEENTLGYFLRQSSLTWESLVTTLHVFSKNLLVPCAYPNPMPSLSRFHVPVPPLPSHFPPHKIHSFCEALYSLVIQIEPSDASHRGLSAERWALVQKIPAAQGGADWFTGNVDQREVDVVKEKGKVQGDLLQHLAAKGDSFAHAHALSSSSAVGGPSRGVRLGDAVLQRASAKMKQWKEARGKRFGGLGAVVEAAAQISVPFQPSFGASYDSTAAGYYITLDAMHQRARLNTWKSQAEHAELGYHGRSGRERSVVEELEDNHDLIQELQMWQNHRLNTGEERPGERENLVAEELAASLGRLAENTSPSDFITVRAGLAHRLARDLVSSDNLSMRGTLDPQRPQALHDNITVRARNTGRYAAPPAPPSTTAHSYSSSPYGMSIFSGRQGYGRTTAMPSGLRQSFGPGNHLYTT